MTVSHRRGRYCVDVRVNISGRVERVQLVAPAQYQSKRGAEQYERIVIAELRAGRDPRRAAQEEARATTRVPTLNEFSVTFLRDYAAVNNEASTVREKKNALRRSILPLLGHLPLDRIGAKEIESYKAQRLAMTTRRGKPPAAKTINEELAITYKMLRTAHEWELIERVPFLRRLKQPPPDFDFLDFEESERLLAAAAKADEPWNVMIPIALMSGLRLGELIALQWDDVDLVRRRLHVRRSMDGKGVLKGTKSNRARRVDLEQKAVVLLKAHKHLRGPFVFCNEDGRPLRHRECESSGTEAREDGPLARVCRRAGLRRIGWHMLRHTYASQLVMSGGMPSEVQDLLGHASLAMTQRYTHLSPTARRAAVDLLEARRSGCSGDKLVTTSPRRS
jgi:integrase